ncbi:MAG: GNAT family N-acetyltransferase [Solirubrobacterales bacterium]|nr:GNAT family N-acetyltransferase [Solirubrobacterales bacterium]
MTDVKARVATEADLDAVVDLLALAFHEDPTWSWAFHDPATRFDAQRAWWRMHVRSAIPHEWVWLTEDGGAASLWIPPGKPELSDEDEARSEPLMRELAGSHADEVLVLLDRFGSNHPVGEPHYYLSLLGTHPDHRGKGIGMSLLTDNLARIDREGSAAYLESSNPDNDERYERLGFTTVGEFSAPGGEPTVACMWRSARA